MTETDAERLWEELRHRDAEGKRAWVEQLARDGSFEAIDLLLAALEHDSWYLRDTATRALGSLGDAVVDPLCELLHSGLWYTRAAAATALGLTALPLAAGPLTVMLRDANRTVRDAARDALLALARQELAAHAVATAFSDLPERAQRFALDGLAERDPDVARGVERLMADPTRRAAAETDPGSGRSPLVDAEAEASSPRLPRAVNDDAPDLLWEDVVGTRQKSRG